jgi:hypothetical protein
MRHFNIIMVVALGFIIMELGCSSGSMISDPLSTKVNVNSESSSGIQSQQLWGMWSADFNPDGSRFELTPIRGAMFQVNVTKFLQPPSAPVNLLTVHIDNGLSQFPSGHIVCDVTVSHPFKGVAKYRGFDVRGIVMGDASTSGASGDGEVWPTISELRLNNADGYTRWWNPTEFTSFGTIFGYTKGTKAPAGFLASGTVNGYKYFADGLDPEAPVTGLDVAERGSFGTTPGINTRRYDLQFPLISGKPSFKFIYAISASYSAPTDNSDPEYPVSSFPIGANTAEAFNVKVIDNGSTAYYENDASKGGDLNLKLEVFDWGLGTAVSATDEVAQITIESPTLLAGQKIVDLGTEEPGSSIYSRIFSISVSNVTPTSVDDQDVLVRVLSTNPSDYSPDIPGISGFEFPQGVPLAAYSLWEATIAPINPQGNHPPEVGIIDGLTVLDNVGTSHYTLSFATDIEDGTNLTILWDNDGDGDFADDLDTINNDLNADLDFPTKGKYTLIARAVDSGGLHTDSVPFIVNVGGCPTEVHTDFKDYQLADAPGGYFSRMDYAFQTVGPMSGKLLVQTQLGEVRAYDVSNPDNPLMGEPYITLQHSNDWDVVYEMDVEDHSGRVIIAMMNKDPMFTPGSFEVYDNTGAYLTTIKTGTNHYVSAFDTDENGDIWVQTWESSSPTTGTSRFQRYVYQDNAPYYFEAPECSLDTTEVFQGLAEVWDIAISYTLRRIYAFRGNYNQGIAPYGEIYTYDINPDFTLTYNSTIQNLNVFPTPVSGNYNNFYGALVDGKIDIDHVSEPTENCRILVQAQRDPNTGWGTYTGVLDENLNMIDTEVHMDQNRRYAFAIGVDPDPSKRVMFTAGYSFSGDACIAQAPPGY